MQQTAYFILFLLLCMMCLISCQKPPVIEKFSGSKGVLMGRESSLSWQVKNAQKVILKNELTGEEQTLAEEKTRFIFKPEKDFKYTLIAENQSGQITKTFEGKVLRNPPIIEYFRGSEKYEVGDKKLAYLEWNVRNAKRIYLRHMVDNLPETFRADSLTLDSTTTFELVAIGEFGDTTSQKHTIEVLKKNYSIRVVDEFNTLSLVKGIENKVHWNFSGAEWVIREFSKDTLASAGDYTIRPRGLEKYYTEKFYVKYPNHDEPNVFIYEAITEQTKVFFKPSKLKTDINTPVSLDWKAKGTKGFKIMVGDEMVYKGQEGADSYTFTIRKPTVVKMLFIDREGKESAIDWLIRCGQVRPFIVDAIDYKTIQNESKKRRLITEIFQTDRSNYPEEITLRVLVTDTLGNFIRGLAPPTLTEAESRKYFKEIIERSGSQIQNISNFKVREVNELQSKPYDVAFCLDYSGSMVADIKALENAIRKMINKKDSKDKFSIVRFDDKLKTEIVLEEDVNEILEKISWRGMNGFGGATALYAGADQALKSLENSEEGRQKIMFLFTDGHENSSFAFAEQGLSYTPLDFVKKARAAGVKVYPIALGENTNERVLSSIGWLTDGYIMNVDNQSKLDSAYLEIPRLFKNYYEITYKPMPDKSDKGQKEVILTYFNNQTIAKTSRKYQNGDNFDLDEYESNENGKKIIVPIQAVAFFGFDRHNLEPEFMPSMESIYNFLVKNPSYQVDILGHTDLVGPEDKNMALSRLRASSVKQYLISRGIDQKRLNILPFGESNPVWDKEDEEWKAKENRRIEVRVWE